jgi:hypothetical protein
LFEIIGILQDPNSYWDSKSTTEDDNHHITFANIIRKLAKGSAAKHENLQMPLASPDQPLEEPSGLESETNWGPKTAKTPEIKTYTSTELESIIDIAPDAPSDICRRTLDLIKSKVKAFGFDNRIGEHPAKAKIRLHDDTIPISLPMYPASPAKRVVIDEQMDKWLSQDVIEPSASPWGAPVVIAYRNEKPRFCIDYRKLNTLTIPDEFPLPCQSEIMQGSPPAIT